MGKNNEEVNGENVSEYVKASDNLEDDADYWALMLLCLLWMQEHENEKLWKNFQNDNYLKNKEVVAIYEKLTVLFPNMKLDLEDVKSDSAMNNLEYHGLLRTV